MCLRDPLRTSRLVSPPSDVFRPLQTTPGPNPPAPKPRRYSAALISSPLPDSAGAVHPQDSPGSLRSTFRPEPHVPLHPAPPTPPRLRNPQRVPCRPLRKDTRYVVGLPVCWLWSRRLCPALGHSVLARQEQLCRMWRRPRPRCGGCGDRPGRPGPACLVSRCQRLPPAWLPRSARSPSSEPGSH